MKPFAHTAVVVGSRFLLLVFLFLVALAQPARAQVQGCGNENETPCPLNLSGNNAICDTGLKLTLQDCGVCQISLPFFGCVLHQKCFSCVNNSRRRLEVDPFVGGWADWALKNQRELAQDEPLNWVTHIATHNSYNTYYDGHDLGDFPNQIYSTTDQLRLGARAITFDNYYINSEARLCHSAFSTDNPVNLVTVETLCKEQQGNNFYPNFPPSMRYYSNGIQEIGNWLDQNPNEIVIVDFEEYVKQMGGPDEAVLAPIRAFFGDMVLTSGASVTGSITGNVLTVTAVGSGTLHVNDQILGTGIPDGAFIQSFGTGTGGTGTYNLSPASLPDVQQPVTITTKGGRFPDRWPTRREMLAAGKRVIILDNAYNTFDFANQNKPSQLMFNQDDTVAGSFGDANGTWLAKNPRRFPNCFSTPDFTQDFKKTLFTKATIIVEERELGEFVGFSLPLFPAVEFGLMSDKDLVDATECNYSIITLDKYSQVLIPHDGSAATGLGSLDYLIYTTLKDFHRQALAVWSWKEGDRGQNGDCAMLEGSSQRWASADCSSNSQVQAKFACAKPRSQSGKDPLQWEDPLGDDWRVTSATGPWSGGTKACLAEFGSDGFVFSVPVSGYQNRRLKDADPAADNIWLNYQQKGDGKWVIPSSPAPVAKAGPNQVVECGNSVNLDAGGSYSPDRLTLSYKWQGPFGIRATQIVNLATPGDLPLGVDPILLAVTDSNGQTATDPLTVTVQDTTPPVIRSVVANPNSSWPPNHKMFPVHLSLDASDACDQNFVCHVVSVTSNEGTPADWEIVGPADVMLRSERSGNGGDRVYTILIQCTDASGNASTRAVTVTIPHDQGKSKP